MSVNEIIVYLMVLFMVIGAVDRILGGRLGLGAQFEEGITAMGSLALSMVGIICLAPVLSRVLGPVVTPVYRLLGADPAMFAGTILANDMGGASLAQELAQTPEAGQFAGLIVASMLGATVVFTIPVGLGIIQAEDRPYLASGVLAGVITAFSHLAWVQNAFAGVRVCVCVLIFNAVSKLWKKSVIDKVTAVIFALVLLGGLLTDLSPVVFVVFAAVVGIAAKVVRK